MLNPSTADATRDDPTIRRCIHFTRRFRCNRLLVVNLFAWRATKPRDLWAAAHAGEDIVGPENDEYLGHALQTSKVVIFAWGAAPGTLAARDLHRARVTKIHELARELWASPWNLGTTLDGSPRHPLYVRSTAPLGREILTQTQGNRENPKEAPVEEPESGTPAPIRARRYATKMPNGRWFGFFSHVSSLWVAPGEHAVLVDLVEHEDGDYYGWIAIRDKYDAPGTVSMIQPSLLQCQMQSPDFFKRAIARGEGRITRFKVTEVAP
jgi:hypothetical protein